MIAAKVEETWQVPQGNEFYCTVDGSVVSIPSSLSKSNISPCLHEEMDTRIRLHARDAFLKGLNKVVN